MTKDKLLVELAMHGCRLDELSAEVLEALGNCSNEISKPEYSIAEATKILAEMKASTSSSYDAGKFNEVSASLIEGRFDYAAKELARVSCANYPNIGRVIEIIRYFSDSRNNP